MAQVIVIGSAHTRRRRRLIRLGLIVSAALGVLWLGSCAVTVVWVLPHSSDEPVEAGSRPPIVLSPGKLLVLSHGSLIYGREVCNEGVRPYGLSMLRTSEVECGVSGSVYVSLGSGVVGGTSMYLFKPCFIVLFITWLLRRKERREARALAMGHHTVHRQREWPGPVLRAVLTVLFAVLLLFPAPFVAAWWVWFFFNEGSHRQPFVTFFQAAAPVKVAFVALALGFMYAGVLLFHDRLRWKRTQFVPGFCTTCGYDLRGNVSGICPECGTRMDALRRVISESEKRAEARTRPEITCAN